MVSISQSMTVENAGTYYRHHYSTRGEYYAESEAPIIGQAVGKGAEALGLAGGVTGEQFETLLRGHDPCSDAILRAKCTRADAVERAGFDMTFSPPKSISLQALVAGDERLIEVVKQAAIIALGEAEQCAFARQRHDGKQEWVQTGNVVGVMFEHHDARESLTSEHGPDPQLHFHTWINNLSQLPNGQWRALDGEQIYIARGYIDGIFMAEVARGVQHLGYRIYRTGDGSFELEGYSRSQIEAFSQRGKDIERTEAELGITDPRMARDIRLETRKAKREHDPEALKAEREALAVELGIDLSFRPTAPVQSFNVSPEVQAQRSVDFALADTTERWAAPDFRRIAASALKHGVGATTPEHINADIAARHEAHQLFAGVPSHSHPLRHYTTREMAKLEAENLALVRNQMDRGHPIIGIPIHSAVDGKTVVMGTRGAAQWIASRKLLPDHAAAALLTLTTPKWASAIEGIAGSAKTSLVGTLADFARQEGWTVRGFSVISGARNALEGVNIEAMTVAKARASPLPAKTGREWWLVDESSLVSTRDLHALLKLAIERGVERITFVGDQRQHLSVTAGSPLRQLLADNLTVSQLSGIRRQKAPELLKVVNLAYHQRIPEAIDRLIGQQRVIQEPDQGKRYERIAADYLDAYQAGQNCLVVSPGNDERRALNQAIRSTLVANGYVNTIGREHQILVPRAMTPAARKDPLSYTEGDLLYFIRGSKRQGIGKGEYLRIETVNDRGLTLVVAESGKRVENFNPASLKGIRTYTPEARTIAVGERLEWREPDNKLRIANHQYGTITGLDDRNIEVEFDNGRKLSMPLADARRVDLGYASTSHASQGSTVHRVIINVDSRRGVDLVNERQLYVSISRPEYEARIYTDDIEQMRFAVSRKQEKELALDLVRQQQKQQQRPSMGMRM